MSKVIYCVMGRSGAGKSTVAREMALQTGMKILKSKTTRPPRAGETAENTDHIFTDQATADRERKDMIAWTMINGAEYWTTKEDLLASDIYVIDPRGINTLQDSIWKSRLDIRLLRIYVEAPEGKRTERILLRDGHLSPARLRDEDREFRECEMQRAWDYLLWNGVDGQDEFRAVVRAMIALIRLGAPDGHTAEDISSLLAEEEKPLLIEAPEPIKETGNTETNTARPKIRRHSRYEIPAVNRENFMALLHRTGMTYEQLSQETGISRYSLLSIAEGKIKNPGTQRLIAIADAFGCPLDVLTGRSGTLSEQDIDDLYQDFSSIREGVLERYYPGLPISLARTVAQRASDTGEPITAYPYNLVQAVFPKDKKILVPLTDDQKKGLDEAIATLAVREQIVLWYRFIEGFNFEQAGGKLGVSRERIRQIEIRALRKLRSPANASMIRYGLRGCGYKQREKKLRDREKYLRAWEKELAQDEARIKEKARALNALRADAEEDSIAEGSNRPDEYCVRIEDADLSARSYNCLRRHNANVKLFRDWSNWPDEDSRKHAQRRLAEEGDMVLETMPDIVEFVRTYGWNKLGKIRNLGQKSQEEIRRKVEEYTGIDIRQIG